VIEVLTPLHLGCFLLFIVSGLTAPRVVSGSLVQRDATPWLPYLRGRRQVRSVKVSLAGLFGTRLVLRCVCRWSVSPDIGCQRPLADGVGVHHPHLPHYPLANELGHSRRS